MSPVADALGYVVDGFPRVSGDEPGAQFINIREVAFSPRERG